MSNDVSQGEVPVLDASRLAPKGKFGLLVALFLWFILLVVVVGLAFFGWQQLSLLKLQFARNAQDLSQVPVVQASFNQQIQSLNQIINQQEKQLSAAQDNLARVNSLVTNNQTGWLIIEAQHLLQLANLSLKFEHNIPVSLTLLTLADQRLFMIGDPALADVRELLSANMVALRAMTPLDQDGLYLKLDALRKETIQLPMINKDYVPKRDENMLASIKNGTNPSVWQRSRTTIVQALSKILIIRHRSVPLQPLLEPNQENILKQNLYWLYSQAQWAVLHQDKAVYQSSLTQLTQLINTYFQLNPEVQSILQSINELQKIEVNAVMPDLNPTLVAMQNYTKTHQQKMIDNQVVLQKTPVVTPPSSPSVKEQPKIETTVPPTTKAQVI